MPVKALHKDILEILYTEDIYLSLSEIQIKLTSHKIVVRTLQKEIKELVNCNRVLVDGRASLTKYTIKNIQKSYPSSPFLYVYKNNVVIGLFFKVKDIYRFYYDSMYLFTYKEAIPSIDLGIQSVDFENIPAVFEENIPEGINREILEIVNQEADEFKILEMLQDSIGDICFSSSLERCTSDDVFEDNYSEVLEEVLGTNPSLNYLGEYYIDITKENLFPEGFDLSKQSNKATDGISGFQYKKLVNIDFDAKAISTQEKRHLYILKPYSSLKANKDSEFYFPHISLNEHLYMSFAKNELGFNVPYSGIVKLRCIDSDDDEDIKEYHYVVKRFDRHGNNRFAKATFSSYLGLRSENKYDTTSEKMFKRIAKELISPKERMELLKHYAYSTVIVHEDMHTKNLSLMISKNKKLFSPLYDIAGTGFYDSTKGYESRLPINGKQKQIRINDFKGLCEILDINFKDFKVEAQKIAELYMIRLPFYFDEFASLELLDFYHKKYKKVRGQSESKLRITSQRVSVIDVMRKHHRLRVKSLITLGWIIIA